jgi:hypothetical protein
MSDSVTLAAPVRAHPARESPARATLPPDTVRDSGGIGNLAIAQHVRSGLGTSASFPGAPLTNQDHVQARRAPKVQAKCGACDEQTRFGGVQAKCDSCASQPLDNARPALTGASESLPHFDRIQASFGRHDLSHVRTVTGGPARDANDAIGALAFTAGDRIGFRDRPDQWLAAHESAHVIQQREGRSVPDGGGAGDPWERHADRVADTVTSGGSAEPLLDQVTQGEGARTPSVQLQEPEEKKDYSDETQEEFEQRVKDAAVARLSANIKVLGKWAGYVASMEGFQLQAQLLTTKVSEYAETAKNLFGGDKKFEALVGTRDPGERSFYEETLSARPTYLGQIKGEQDRLSSKAFGYWSDPSIADRLQVLAGDRDLSSLPESEFVGPELGYEFYADFFKRERSGKVTKFRNPCQWCHEFNLAYNLTVRTYGTKYPSMGSKFSPMIGNWSPKDEDLDSVFKIPNVKREGPSPPSRDEIEALSEFFRSAAPVPQQEENEEEAEYGPPNPFVPETEVPEAVSVPPPRTGLCGKPKAPAEGAPSPNLSSWGPNSAIVAGVIARINAVLAPLGPRGYNVLPASNFGALWSMTPENMEGVQSEIIGAINARAGDYQELIGSIQGGAVDYFTLCPIVDELAPSTNETVRDQALADVKGDQMAEAVLTGVELFLVGLSFMFPPAAVATVPTLMALGLVRASLGYEQMKQSEQQQLGTGAGIFSPDQEAEAEALGKRGKINLVTGLLSAATGAMGTASMLSKGKPAWNMIETSAGTMCTHPEFRGAVWIEGNTMVMMDEAGNTIAHGTIVNGQIFMRSGAPPANTAAAEAVSGAMVPYGANPMVPFGGTADDLPFAFPGVTATKPPPSTGGLVFGEGETPFALLTTGEKPPLVLRPWESPQEAGEIFALNQARPNSIPLPPKVAGYDGVEGGKFLIVGQQTDGVRVIVDIKIVHAKEATQIKQLSGISTKPIPEQVVNNVKTALNKSWKQWNHSLEIKASPEPLPGQPNVFPRVDVVRPRGIVYVVEVPIDTPFEQLAIARQAALDYLAKSNTAAALPPIDVVVQYIR